MERDDNTKNPLMDSITDGNTFMTLVDGVVYIAYDKHKKIVEHLLSKTGAECSSEQPCTSDAENFPRKIASQVFTKTNETVMSKNLIKIPIQIFIGGDDRRIYNCEVVHDSDKIKLEQVPTVLKKIVDRITKDINAGFNHLVNTDTNATSSENNDISYSIGKSFKPGDIVSLRSNKKQRMTVERFWTFGKSSNCYCSWWNEQSDTFEHNVFNSDELQTEHQIDN